MNVKCFKVGWLSTNCYVVSCPQTKQAAIIDPGLESKPEADQILNYMKQNSLKVKYIINTHAHPDHISGNEAMKKETGAPILIFEQSAEHINADQKLCDKDTLQIGNIKLKVLHTPGHTPDGICLVGAGVVFTGDSLFAGAIGRTDFPGGSFSDLMNSIKIKLLTLPDNLIVYPGHESFSTIGDEKKYNPFLQN